MSHAIAFLNSLDMVSIFFIFSHHYLSPYTLFHLHLHSPILPQSPIVVHVVFY